MDHSEQVGVFIVMGVLVGLVYWQLEWSPTMGNCASAVCARFETTHKLTEIAIAVARKTETVELRV